jgi:hypothetical protein
MHFIIPSLPLGHSIELVPRFAAFYRTYVGGLRGPTLTWSYLLGRRLSTLVVGVAIFYLTHLSH